MTEARWIRMACARRALGLRIHGIATSGAITENNQASNSMGMDADLPVPLHFGHRTNGAKPIGEVYFIERSPRGVYIQAALFDHAAAKYAEGLILAGEVGCLSIGHASGKSRLSAEVDGVKFYDRWTLGEVSLTRRGANPDARFTILRNDEDDEFRSFRWPG